MNIQKQAFSFIELLITVSIIVLLTIIGLSVNTSYTIKANNSRITADLDTAYNALVGHIQVEGNLPIPGGNKNYFSQTGNYTHSWTQTGTYGVYGSLTEHTLSKKYIDSVPRDHNTNNYFAYGITRPDVATEVANQFEISAIIQNGNSYNSIVKGNYTGNGGIYNLIRSYNGPDYVYNNSEALFPYNPESIELTARLQNTSGNISINGDISNIDRNLISGDIINIEQGGRAEMYLSDGSISILGGTDATTNTQITVTNLSRPKENNLLSQVSLFLASGNIWTKATDLNDDGSEFQISTVDGTASVRGTIFGVINDGASTKVAVVQGNVEISTQTSSHNNTIEVAEGEPAKIFQLNKYNSYDLEESTLPYQPDITTTAITPVADNIISDPVGTNNPDGTTGGSGTEPTGSYPKENENKDLPLTGCNAIADKDGYKLDSSGVMNKINGFGVYQVGGTVYQMLKRSTRPNPNGIITHYEVKFQCKADTGEWKYFNDKREWSVAKNCTNLNNKERSIFRDECVEKVEGMSLYAKADYDVAGNIDLLKVIKANQDKPETIPDTFTLDHDYILSDTCGSDQGNCKSDHLAYEGTDSTNLPKSWASFPSQNGRDSVKGIFVDNFTTPNPSAGVNADPLGLDFIKYSGLELEDNFILEMSVKKSDLERTDGLYTLFDFGISDITNIKFYNYLGTNKLNSLDLPNSFNCISDFCKVQFIKKDNYCSIKIGATSTPNLSCSNFSSNMIYVGTNVFLQKQWNGIISSVKIYQ